jgi:SAM-dependent methyltransferase
VKGAPALVPAMARKWKQINRFVEIFSAAFADSALAQSQRPVRVADFGSGKGYLTFAMHDWLHRQGVEPRVAGIELREDMVRLCQTIVDDSALVGLRFDQGDVRSFEPGALDVMIALHACDIATDHAIHLGLQAGAQIIMCSPCCHKELRPQMQMPAALRPMLQHGIHLGQEAEMVTDSLRAMLLESKGYATQVFEFVALEHTSKNKMILAVKAQGAAAAALAARRPELLAQISEIKRFYGLREQRLESLLCPA